MSFCCECRGPCRRSVDITPDTYAWLRSMGAVLNSECAEREGRNVIYRYNGSAVVATTIGRKTRKRISQKGAR
jgi:hypothetical protein